MIGSQVRMTRAGRLLAVALVALTASCSAVLVRPVVHKKAEDGSVQPTCFTNSYVWPALDTVAAALFVVLPLLAQREHNMECDGTDCGSSRSLVLLWGAPIWGASAYAGFSGARTCRAAGSTSRWRSWMYDPPPNGGPDRTPWQITPTR